MIADKAYSSKAIRRLLRSRRIGCTIPQRSDQRNWRRLRGSYGGRPPAFDRSTYKRRNLVERCIGRLKHYRGIATRFDKLATHYRAGIVLVSALFWLNHEPKNTTYGRVEVVLADGESGAPDRAPFDRIIVTVGAWGIPHAWPGASATGTATTAPGPGRCSRSTRPAPPTTGCPPGPVRARPRRRRDRPCSIARPVPTGVSASCRARWPR